MSCRARQASAPGSATSAASSTAILRQRGGRQGRIPIDHPLARADRDTGADPPPRQHHRRSVYGDVTPATATVDMACPSSAEHRRPRTASADLPNPPAMDPAAALAWLDAERPNLVATCAHATAHGWPDHATHLAAILYRYLDLGGHHCDALAVHTNAERATGHTGDPAADACVLISLGSVYWRQGHGDKATRYHQQALALYREAGNHSGEALALNMLGLVHHQQGQYQQAASHYQQALTLHRETGERTGEALRIALTSAASTLSKAATTKPPPTYSKPLPFSARSAIAVVKPTH